MDVTGGVISQVARKTAPPTTMAASTRTTMRESFFIHNPIDSGRGPSRPPSLSVGRA